MLPALSRLLCMHSYRPQACPPIPQSSHPRRSHRPTPSSKLHGYIDHNPSQSSLRKQPTPALIAAAEEKLARLLISFPPRRHEASTHSTLLGSHIKDEGDTAEDGFAACLAVFPIRCRRCVCGRSPAEVAPMDHGTEASWNRTNGSAANWERLILGSTGVASSQSTLSMWL